MLQNQYLVQLSATQFNAVRQLVYDLAGIDFQPGKAGLVNTRLTSRLRKLNITSFEEYWDRVTSDKSGAELAAMIDVLTTNKTQFFREAEHFEFLRREVLPHYERPGKKLRIWSAGCSSGEEPYTLALLVLEHIPAAARRDARILATDISERVLEKAKRAQYSEEQVAAVPPALLKKYFKANGSKPNRTYAPADEVRSLIRYARLNLMAHWPMKGPFDVIFCRNVMIYFDKPTQKKLVSRFCGMLAAGGYLFIGHSESLAGSVEGLKYVQPAVYRKG